MDLREVMTFQEAAKLWGLADASILRNAVRRGRFRPDEVRKSAGTWLVTRAAMERLYGPAKKS